MSMKRLIKAGMTLALVLCLSLFSVNADAANPSATLTGPGTVRAGDTVTVTFNLSGSGLFGVSGALSYDSSQVTLTGTAQKIGSPWMVEFNGNNFLAYDNNLTNPVNSNTAVFTATFKVKNVAAGEKINISCTNVTATDGSADTVIGTAACSISVAPPLSTDNTLNSLTVSNATLSPGFSSGTTSYTASVPYEVSKLDLKATANDAKAKVSVNNPTLTPAGATTVSITVTAENGATRTYTISVTRAQDPNYVSSSNNHLSSISVSGFLLSPVFSKETTEYVIWLPYETESVSLSGVAEDSKASVRVEGGNELVAGQDNVVKVICTAEDGAELVYTVIVKRAAAHNAEPPTEESTMEEPTTEEPTTEEPTTEAPTEESTEAEVPGTTPPSGYRGIPWWVLIIVALISLALGAGGGIWLDRNYLDKDEDEETEEAEADAEAEEKAEIEE